MKLRHVFLALALAVPGLATATEEVNVPAMLVQIDQLMASTKDLDQETKKLVEELRADGEKAHKDGKDEKAVEELTQALLLLGAY